MTRVQGYVQYVEYISFVKAMDGLRGMKLVYFDTEEGKAYAANVRVSCFLSFLSGSLVESGGF